MNKYISKLLFLFFLVGSLLLSCSESTFEEPAIEMGYEYYPLEIGKYWVYQVDSVVYDTTGAGVVVETSSSIVREAIIDTLTDNEGQLNYQIERSWRPDASSPWQLQDIWLSNRNEETAERVEENFRFIKMVFPLTAGRSWDGNIFIDKTTNIVVAGETIEIFKNWFYEINFVGEPVAVGAFNFEEAAEIVQADSENFIELRYSLEQYAKGVGLVFREMRILDTQRISETEPWEDKAQKGFTLTQRLIEHN